MSEAPSGRRAAASAARELVLWTALIGAFLYVYAAHPAGGPQAVWPHVKVVGWVAMALAGLRMAVWRWLPGRAAPRLVAAAIATTATLLLSGYYLLVVTGLWSWGRVASWSLVARYVGQVPELAQSLGVPLLGAGTLAVVIVTVALWLVDGTITRCDWTNWASMRLGPTGAGTAAIGAIALAMLQLSAYAGFPALTAREPFSLTFLAPPDEGQHMNSHIQVSPGAVAAARRARDRYRPLVLTRRPNVILVVVDALRPDRLSAYGYERDTTPHLAAMQRRGQLVVVPRTVAACPESYCGLLAIARSKPLHLMTDDDLSLHEVLNKHGYRIALMLGGDHTNFYGLRAAYGAVDEYFDGSMDRTRSINDDESVIERVKAMPAWDGRPVMIQFHLMSAHLLGARSGTFDQYRPAKPYVPWRKGAAADLSKPQFETGNHYDNGVRQLDDVVRRLVEALAEREYLRDAIVVLTGDHGEMLGEHGEFGHAKGVYEPAMRVPLLFAVFGGPPPVLAGAADGLVSQLDIAPTVLQYLGMPAPENWIGLPLQLPMKPRLLAFQQGYFVGVYDEGQPGRKLKYWRNIDTGAQWAFDVLADPAESVNLVSQLDPSYVEALQQTIRPMAAAVPR